MALGLAVGRDGPELGGELCRGWSVDVLVCMRLPVYTYEEAAKRLDATSINCRRVRCTSRAGKHRLLDSTRVVQVRGAGVELGGRYGQQAGSGKELGGDHHTGGREMEVYSCNTRDKSFG